MAARKLQIYAWVSLTAAFALLPFGAEAQQARRPYRIGVLNEAWAANHPTVEGLKAGLRQLGLQEGRDVTFDIRFTEGKPQATPEAAAALVKAGVDVIFTSNEASTQAAKAATSKLPIVFTLVGDPVAAGVFPGDSQRPRGEVDRRDPCAGTLRRKRYRDRAAAVYLAEICCRY